MTAPTHPLQLRQATQDDLPSIVEMLAADPLAKERISRLIQYRQESMPY